MTACHGSSPQFMLPRHLMTQSGALRLTSQEKVPLLEVVGNKCDTRK